MYLNRFSLKAVIILGISTLLVGCAGYQYKAGARFVPLNEKKGELTANLYLTGIQAGYSFSNKFSGFATGFRSSSSGIGNPIGAKKNHRSDDFGEINIGLSYFKSKPNSTFEVLVGGGVGNMSYANDFEMDKNGRAGYTFNMQAKRKNIFIQPNLGYKLNNSDSDKTLKIAFFAKLNMVHYYNIRTEGTFGSEAEPDPGIDFFRTRSEAYLLFIEPGVFLKSGSKLKGMFQISPIINLSGHSIRHKMFSMNVGVSMNFDLLKGKII